MNLKDVVHKAVAQPVLDLHTHLYSPDFGDLMLCGVDELVTYHYLIAEFFRASDMAYEAFDKLSTKQRADVIWQALFVAQTPMSEACRGVLTALDRIGAPKTKDLEKIRSWYAGFTKEQLIEKVFEAANVSAVVMTNDPFNRDERALWLNGTAQKRDPRFLTALRIDPLLLNFGGIAADLESMGYHAGGEGKFDEAKRFVADWIARIDARYCAVSLPGSVLEPDGEGYALLTKSVLPACREANIPFAMMIGVRRNINPALGLAGDGLELSDLSRLEDILKAHPHNRFMVTTLQRENQHALCILARKFKNLMPFGCWWFLNNPSFIEEMTTMRMELLGLSFVPQHSDARILDQLAYKWAHSRAIIEKVLVEKYELLLETGWPLEEGDIFRDAQALLSGNFTSFVKG